MSSLQPPLELLGPAVPRFLVHMSATHLPSESVDVLVIGGGVAGLSAAVAASEGRRTLALLKTNRSKTATGWAQGGMAAVMAGDDSTSLHAQDTEEVAAGLAHEDVVREIVAHGPSVVERWLEWGGRFDRDAAGQLLLAMEGGHSRDRIIHANGDQTGAEIQRLLIAKAASQPELAVREETFVLDLLTEGDVVRGALVWSRELGYHVVWAGATILCTGGVGRVYRESSNPKIATGDGHAMAYRAGAVLRGMEFVQFHPTVLYVAGMARFLVSETARGEGGKLVDRHGERFMPQYHPKAELAPRDVVSRSIVEHIAKIGDTHVYLDMRHLDEAHLRERFPVIYKACADFGIDMARDLIPVHPASHYMVGGVASDSWGCTSLPGLYAAGEVGNTGFHGANRMGSNSLLEGAVVGDRAGRHAAEHAGDPVRRADDEAAPLGHHHAASLDPADLDASLRALMWRDVGIQREGGRLESSLRRLGAWREIVTQRVLGDPFGWSLVNKLTVSELITQAALARSESRGTHFRLDHPERDDQHWRREVELRRGADA